MKKFDDIKDYLFEEIFNIIMQDKYEAQELEIVLCLYANLLRTLKIGERTDLTKIFYKILILLQQHRALEHSASICEAALCCLENLACKEVIK